jgi:hypothetical protein
LNPLETRGAPAAAPQAAPGQSTPAAQQPAANTAPANPAPASSGPAPGNVQVKATAGVGQKGKSLEQHTGVLVEPAKAFFRFEQKAVFDIQIPQALQLFNATEGRNPNSQDEFMTKIVAANNIKLPKLPDGHKYVYKPELGELWVEKPAK